MVHEREEDQASLPIRVKHKLLPVAAPHNISKAEVIYTDARCPDPAGKHGLAICVHVFMQAVELIATVQTAHSAPFTWQIFAWLCNDPAHRLVHAPTGHLLGPL